MQDPYLVLFVVDPAADEHAVAFADLARAVLEARLDERAGGRGAAARHPEVPRGPAGRWP